MNEKEYYAIADRIKFVDERTASEMLKQTYADCNVCNDYSEFWENYVKRSKRNGISIYIPLSVILDLKKEYEEYALNYSVVSLLESIAICEDDVFLGIDYTKLDEIEECIVSAAEYLTKSQRMLYLDTGFIIRITYRKDYNNRMVIYIDNESGQLRARIPKLIDDIRSFQYELKVDEYIIPKPLTEEVVSCIQNDYRKFALTQFLHEDDRCFLEETFSIYVVREYLALPKTKDGFCKYAPIEYFPKGERSAFREFNDLLAYLYDVLPDDDKKQFPFI